MQGTIAITTTRIMVRAMKYYNMYSSSSDHRKKYTCGLNPEMHCRIAHSSAALWVSKDLSYLKKTRFLSGRSLQETYHNFQLQVDSLALLLRPGYSVMHL